jgi:hypothetical protein
LEWTRADAVDWLCDRIEPFDVLIDDLSIPVNGDVIKPEVSWTILPELIRSRLAPAGVAVLNLLKPENESWSAGLARVAGVFREALMIELDDFQNRIVVAGAKLPDARALSTGLRASLKGLRSRQATRLRLRTLA